MNSRKSKNKKPEESVRKFIIDYLVQDYNYNRSLFRIEKKIHNITQVFRPDIVIYDNKCNPFMIIECKAPNIKLDENTVLQIIKYNNFLNSKYILITNGIKIFCWELCNKKYIKSKIPEFTSS